MFRSLVLLCALAGIALASEASFNEFAKTFNKKYASTEEFAKRREIFMDNYKLMLKHNQEYEEGKVSFFESVNEFSNLPDAEFLEQKTGAIEDGFYRGFIDATDEDRYDEESERYFDQFRYSRATTPDSYNSVDMGNFL